MFSSVSRNNLIIWCLPIFLGYLTAKMSRHFHLHQVACILSESDSDEKGLLGQ